MGSPILPKGATCDVSDAGASNRNEIVTCSCDASEYYSSRY